jgi:succinylglutamic semialdehyde dehydrogenase
LFDPLMVEINKLIGRLIIGEPHADPAPFMGPVIDNDAADMLTESFLALSRWAAGRCATWSARSRAARS